VNQFQYAVKLSLSDEGGFVVTRLVFPPSTKVRRGEHLVSPPADTVAKAALYIAMTEAGITNVELAKRLGIDEKAVRRLLDPHDGSKLPRIAQAIAALDRRLVIGLQAD
jgi:antitoxin HicB